ncbi:MAG: hypothetical protein ACYCV0_11220 [Desulfitobacteriaceae bacterium]
MVVVMVMVELKNSHPRSFRCRDESYSRGSTLLDPFGSTLIKQCSEAPYLLLPSGFHHSGLAKGSLGKLILIMAQ